MLELNLAMRGPCGMRRRQLHGVLGLDVGVEALDPGDGADGGLELRPEGDEVLEAIAEGYLQDTGLADAWGYIDYVYDI